MRKSLASIATVTALSALLSACGNMSPTQPVSSYPTYPSTSSYPSTTYPSTTYPSTGVYPAGTQQMSMEYGRITNIEYVPVSTTTMGANGTMAGVNTTGAVVGGVIGAVVGNIIGKNVNNGGSRTGATVLGGAAGAAIGSQVNKPPAGSTASNSGSGAYRVTVQTDQGAWRTYEVSATGELHVGDRVRIENNVIYRS